MSIICRSGQRHPLNVTFEDRPGRKMKDAIRNEQRIESGGEAGIRNGPALSRFNSKDLFKGQTRLVIEHEGSEYLLSLTRQGKLILTK